MLAETCMVADTANEVLLYIGLRRSSPEPDPSHPFGYGQERWFWSFMAALGIFLVGGLLAIAEGVRALLNPEPLESFLVGLAVLVVSFVLEGISWRNAYKEVRKEAKGGGAVALRAPLGVLGPDRPDGVLRGHGRTDRSGPRDRRPRAAPGDRLSRV